jgi:hypothetical protein
MIIYFVQAAVERERFFEEEALNNARAEVQRCVNTWD